MTHRQVIEKMKKQVTRIRYGRKYVLTYKQNDILCTLVLLLNMKVQSLITNITLILLVLNTIWWNKRKKGYETYLTNGKAT